MTGQYPIQHEWGSEGRKINTPENRAVIRQVLEKGPIIVEHWLYCGGRCPERKVFDNFEQFEEYLNNEAKPGDAFHIWDFAALCRDDNSIANGKLPDANGHVPKRGAY